MQHRKKILFASLFVLLLLFVSATTLFAAETSSAGEPIQLNNQMIVVIGVLIFVILLFVFEWVRVDVVGIIMMVLLPILGLVEPKEAACPTPYLPLLLHLENGDMR
ncbi:MAG: hypothetical protein V3V59_02520 [Thermodesulfovibrionales bacterium]